MIFWNEKCCSIRMIFMNYRFLFFSQIFFSSTKFLVWWSILENGLCTPLATALFCIRGGVQNKNQNVQFQPCSHCLEIVAFVGFNYMTIVRNVRVKPALKLLLRIHRMHRLLQCGMNSACVVCCLTKKGNELRLVHLSSFNLSLSAAIYSLFNSFVNLRYVTSVAQCVACYG